MRLPAIYERNYYVSRLISDQTVTTPFPDFDHAILNALDLCRSGNNNGLYKRMV